MAAAGSATGKGAEARGTTARGLVAAEADNRQKRGGQRCGGGWLPLGHGSVAGWGGRLPPGRGERGLRHRRGRQGCGRVASRAVEPRGK